MNLARRPLIPWQGHAKVVAIGHGDVLRLDRAPGSARRAARPKALKLRAQPIVLHGLRSLCRGVPANCVLVLCSLCLRAFSPLQGPCGGVLCLYCLREYLPSDPGHCSACGPAQRGVCRVRHAPEPDQGSECAR